MPSVVGVDIGEVEVLSLRIALDRMMNIVIVGLRIGRVGIVVDREVGGRRR